MKDKHFYAPKSWDSLCTPKECGGLGFRRVADQNRALLSKTAWALSKESNDSTCKILKYKYGNFLYPKSRNETNQSMIRKGLESCRGTIAKGAGKVIGNGLSTKVWADRWVPGNIDLYTPSSSSIAVDLDMKVSDLILPNPKRWNSHLIYLLFDDATARDIMSIYLPQEDISDELVWFPNATGEHTVRSFYMLDQESRLNYANRNFWRKLWGLKLHERYKLH